MKKGGENMDDLADLLVEPTPDVPRSAQFAFDLLNGTDFTGWSEELEEIHWILQRLESYVLDGTPHASVRVMAEEAFYEFVRKLGVAFDNYDPTPSY